MKALSLFSVLLLAACAHERHPASLTQNVAKDSMALGNVEASAVKTYQDKSTCFDISLRMKGVEQKEASASNWTVAWVDPEGRYHLLNMNQRDPASVPQGGQKVAPYGAYEEWTNSFKACAPNANPESIKTLVLTPKELSYRETEGLKLEWK